MQRTLILGSVLLAMGAMGVTRFLGIEQRLTELDRLRREVPESARAIQADLAQLETELADMRAGLERARREGSVDRETLDATARRIEDLSAQLVDSRQALDLKETRLTQAVEAHSQRLSELETSVVSRWDGLAETVQAAARLAERTSQELVSLDADLRGTDEEVRWREMVGPTVQLAGDTTVGSGVLLASRAEPGRPGAYETLLITAWHVVRDIRADALVEDPPIPVAIYLEDGSVRHELGRVLAHDVPLDIALLRLECDQPVPFGAALPTRTQLDALRIFHPIYAVGCPLGNDPIPTRGEIADLQHQVDGNRYWMISAPTYIGNSGGGIFDGHAHLLLGIFSKIYTHGSLHPTVVPHMGLVTPMPLVYDWLETNGYAELIPGERGMTLSLAEPLRR